MKIYQVELRNMFIQLMGGMKQSLSHAMKAQGLNLSPLHFVVMHSVHHTPGCTSNALAELLKKDKGQLTRLVKDLVNHGFVKKVANPTDRRSQYIVLTEEGLESFRRLEQYDFATLESMREGISDEELAQFMSIGAKMIANMDRGF